MILWGFEEGEGERFRAMISAIVFEGAPFWTAREGARGHGGRFWVRRWALSFAEHEPWGDFLGLVGARGARFRVRGAEGEMKKGSSDAEGAIG